MNLNTVIQPDTNDDGAEPFTVGQAIALYQFILRGGAIRSDVYGDWFVAEMWDSDHTENAPTPIAAALSLEEILK